MLKRLTSMNKMTQNDASEYLLSICLGSFYQAHAATKQAVSMATFP